MKTLIKYLLMCIITLLPVFLLANTVQVKDPPMPTGLLVYAISFVVLIFGTIIGTKLFNSLISVYGFLKQFVSWIVAFFLCFLAWAFQLGMFNDVNWRMIIVWGVIIALMSNSVRDALIRIPLKISINKTP